MDLALNCLAVRPVEHILHVIQSPDWNSFVSENAIRSREVEVEVGHCVIAHVRLSSLESEGAHLTGIHDELFGLQAGHALRVGCLEQLDSLGDAVLELREGCFRVFEDGDWGVSEALDGELGGVGAGVDLVREAVIAVSLGKSVRAKYKLPFHILDETEGEHLFVGNALLITEFLTLGKNTRQVLGVLDHDRDGLSIQGGNSHAG